RIETAKRALVMLLRSLPTQGTWFNIVSFGSHSDSLWGQSVAYDERSLTQATRYIDTMSANYGGTEMRSALQQAFSLRKTDVPTSVFVLTDGEAYNIDQTIQPVEQAVRFAKTSAPVRVFTLGIGETTSSALCEGMARAGNGLCLMATTAETIIGKCSRLVRASRTYILKNVSVDWGVRNDLAEAYHTGSKELKSVRQAPANISAIYPGNRFVVFALVEDRSFTPPQEIVIRAQRDGQGEVLQFSVPVQIAEFPPEHHPQPLIQTLAARRAIMDIEDSSRSLFTSDAKALVIRLGTQYQLASKYTSFIAVDKRTKSELESYSDEPDEEEYAGYFQSTGFLTRGQTRSALLGASAPRAALVTTQFQPQMSMNRGGGAWSSPLVQHSDVGAEYLERSGSPSRSSPERVSIKLSTRRPRASAAFPGPPAPKSQNYLMSLGRQGPIVEPTSDDRERDRERERAPAGFASGFHSLSSSLEAVSASRGVLQHASPSYRTGAARNGDVGMGIGGPTSPRSTEERVVELIRLQSFDGSFPPENRLLSLLGGGVSFGEARALGVSEKVWATVLAVAYLQQHMKDQPELLEGLVEKATEFIARIPGINVGALFSRAEAFFPSA
ncbi:hypothetical protein PHLGIDRAFT_121049, partial [Phlebiopsis gigantea 11061_1 CR5-6]